MRLYSAFMIHAFRDKIEGILFLGSYEDVFDAIDCINREAKAKEEFLKDLYIDDSVLIDLSNDGDGFAEVFFGQEEIYKFFYVDSELNKKTYVDITNY